MRIKKVLNNNAAIVVDDGQEKIAIGPGIGFNKGKNDIVSPQKIEKIFVLEEKDKLEQLLRQIPQEHFDISEEIISYAEKTLNVSLNEHIHLVLTDHISFAIQKAQEGINIENKLLHEIRILYPEEFAIGQWAIQHIKQTLGVELPEDEAGFIAIHIHTMKPHSNNLQQTLRTTTILQEMMHVIQEEMGFRLDANDWSYQRLMIHLRFALTNNQVRHHTLDEEMLFMIKRKYLFSYQIAQRVVQKISSRFNISIPEQEIGYITLHLERLRQNHLHEKN